MPLPKAPATKMLIQPSTPLDLPAYELICQLCRTGYVLHICPCAKKIEIEYHPSNLPKSSRNMDTITIAATEIRFRNEATTKGLMPNLEILTKHQDKGEDFVVDYMTWPTIHTIAEIARKHFGIGKKRSDSHQARLARIRTKK